MNATLCYKEMIVIIECTKVYKSKETCKPQNLLDEHRGLMKLELIVK